jgi:hypothetical protein
MIIIIIIMPLQISYRSRLHVWNLRARTEIKKLKSIQTILISGYKNSDFTEMSF